MNVTTKQGKQGVITIDSKSQTAVLTVDGVNHLIAYIRDNKVKVKSDLYLNDGDLASVRTSMVQFVKKVDLGKKKRK
jgi:hypothetical protein